MIVDNVEEDLTKELAPKKKIIEEKTVLETAEEIKDIKETVVETKKQIVELTDAMSMFEVINAVKSKKTINIPLISQGLELVSEAMTLSDIHNVVKSDKYRVRIYEKCFEKLTPESKKVFDNKLIIFKESVSYYDMDMFLSKHIDSWGEEEFENVCTGDNCEEVLKYKKPLTEMIVMGDKLKKRLEEISQGISRGVFTPEAPIYEFNEKLKLILSLPSIKRFEMVSNMDIPEILIPAILHTESLLIDLPDADDIYEIKLTQETVKDIISILDQNKVAGLNEKIGETFEYLDIKYEAKVSCPACGTINRFTRVDLVDTFIAKVLN